LGCLALLWSVYSTVPRFGAERDSEWLTFDAAVWIRHGKEKHSTKPSKVNGNRIQQWLHVSCRSGSHRSPTYTVVVIKWKIQIRN
jgi:hypothetical protein